MPDFAQKSGWGYCYPYVSLPIDIAQLALWLRMSTEIHFCAVKAHLSRHFRRKVKVQVKLAPVRVCYSRFWQHPLLAEGTCLVAGWLYYVRSWGRPLVVGPSNQPHGCFAMGSMSNMRDPSDREGLATSRVCVLDY